MAVTHPRTKMLLSLYQHKAKADFADLRISESEYRTILVQVQRATDNNLIIIIEI